jgi:uncharacterized protein (DUF1778 family)
MKKKTGRPLLLREDRRHNIVAMCLNDSERGRVEAAATMVGQSISEFTRLAVIPKVDRVLKEWDQSVDSGVKP